MNITNVRRRVLDHTPRNIFPTPAGCIGNIDNFVITETPAGEMRTIICKIVTHKRPGLRPHLIKVDFQHL